MDRTFDHVILFSFWVSCFSLRNRMSFLKQIKTGRKDRRENAEKRFKPWEIMLFPSVFFLGLSPFFKWLFSRHGNTIQDTLLNDRYIKKRNFKRLFTSIFLMTSSSVMWTWHSNIVMSHVCRLIYMTCLCRRLAFVFFFWYWMIGVCVL